MNPLIQYLVISGACKHRDVIVQKHLLARSGPPQIILLPFLDAAAEFF